MHFTDKTDKTDNNNSDDNDNDNNDGSWTLLDSQSDVTFENRGQRLVFELQTPSSTPPTVYNQFRFEFLAVGNPEKADAIQLAGVDLMRCGGGGNGDGSGSGEGIGGGSANGLRGTSVLSFGDQLAGPGGPPQYTESDLKKSIDALSSAAASAGKPLSLRDILHLDDVNANDIANINANADANANANANANAGAGDGTKKISPVVTKMIHQTWMSHHMPNRFTDFVKSWLKLNPDWRCVCVCMCVCISIDLQLLFGGCCKQACTASFCWLYVSTF